MSENIDCSKRPKKAHRRLLGYVFNPLAFDSRKDMLAARVTIAQHCTSFTLLEVKTS